MQIALFGRPVKPLASRSTWYVASSGGQSREDAVQVFDGVCLATDHHAVAALQTPDSTARSHVDVVNPLRCQFLGPTDIINVVGISSVDEDVVRPKMRQKVGNALIHHGRRDHQPDRPRLLQPLHEIRQRVRSGRLFLNQIFDHLRRSIEDDARVSALHQAPSHICSHPSKTNHSELHRSLLHLPRRRVTDIGAFDEYSMRAHRGAVPRICVRLTNRQDARLSFRYLRIRLFVELSCVSEGSVSPSSSGMMRWASTLPSSTPHWSNELIFQMVPCVKTACS